MRGIIVSKGSVTYLTQEKEKLDYLRKKTPFDRFSDKEYGRRWDKIRRFMDAHQLDCLLIAGGNTAWQKGWSNIRYATDFIGSMEACCFLVFPKDGDPAMCGAVPNYAHRLYRSIIDDLRGGPSGALTVHRIEELGLQSGRIGIVEHTSKMPRDIWETLKTKLPSASFEFVEEAWWKEVRFPLSEEEEVWMKKAGKIGDLCLEALRDKLKPGMKEDDIFATAVATSIANGGENENMMLIGSHSMLDPDADDTSARPRDRILKTGDIVLTEIGPEYNGYEAQCGWPITFGEPTKEYQDMLEVAFGVYHKIVGQLRAGNTTEDIVKVGDIIDEAGYKSGGPPLLHSLPSGLIGNGPMVPQRGQFQSWEAIGRPFKSRELIAGKLACVEVSLVRKDELAGVFLADSFIVRDGPPTRLYEYPTELTVI